MLVKKIQLLTVAAALLIPIGALAQNDINPADEFQPAYGPFAITLDGDLSEWAAIPTLEDTEFVIPKQSGWGNGTIVTHEELSGTWDGPADQSAITRFAWDEENLYVAVTVIDDYHENGANSPWNGDSIQIMIADSDRESQVGLYNFALGGDEGTGDFLPVCGPDVVPCIIQFEAGPGGADVDSIDAAIIRQPGFTNYELVFEIESLDLPELAAGVNFGFGMAINDGDEEAPGQGGWVGWGAHSIVFGKTPSETGVLALVELPPTGPRCDFDADGLCDGVDINLLMHDGETGGTSTDLNGDGVVNDTDRDEWLALAGPENGFGGPLLVGDANLDGINNATDLNPLGINWQDADAFDWTGGNFVIAAGPGVVVGDLNGMASNWQQSAVAAAAGEAVPEPASLALVIAGLFGLFVVRRR